MHFSTITLFELGQFLRIVLWIAIPMIMLSILAAVYIHHRKKATQKAGEGQCLLSSGEDVFSELPAKRDPTPQELETEGETVYQGLLWMKNKYEQDREQSTAKYMQLKEEHGQLLEKYLQLDTRHLYTQELLNERLTTIDRLREQLQQEIQRTEEVKGKLASSGLLLLKIHKELDQVLVRDASLTEADEKIGHPDNPAAEGEPITAWVESEAI